MAGYAVVEQQHLAKQRLLGQAELGHVHAALRPTHRRSDRDEHHLDQIVGNRCEDPTSRRGCLGRHTVNWDVPRGW